MLQYHLQIIAEIQKCSGLDKPDFVGFGLKYVGTNKPSYHLDTKDTRKIAKDFVKSHPYNLKEYICLLDSLYSGESYDEVNIAAKIIEFSPELRQQFNIESLNSWLSYVHGWAEVDTLCQMAFTDEDLLSRWNEWEKFLTKLSLDSNVHKRRASLVLLTKPARLSSDSKISSLAFINVERLKHEKDILITKAVSWILRCLIKNHEKEVADYLENNKDSLPKIAIRETTMKLLTGKKYINNSKIKTEN